MPTSPKKPIGAVAATPATAVVATKEESSEEAEGEGDDEGSEESEESSGEQPGTKEGAGTTATQGAVP